MSAKNIFTALFLLLALAATAQAPSKFRYQAVARDQSGIVINGNINIRLTFLEDGPNGQQRYTETHNVNTNTQGVFDLTIGAGTPTLGDIDDVTWKSHDYWLKVEMKTSGASNFTEMGKTQLMSVPYAKYAEQSGSSLTAGPGIAINNGVVSNTGDLSNNNELQTLTINGNLLSISNGNVVTLPTGTTYTEGSGIDINGNTISATDVSPNNEIQTLSLNGQQLSLSNGGGSVTLPGGGGGNSLWSLNGNVLSNNPTTNSVAIGTTSSGSPSAKLNVSASGGDIAGKFYSSGGGAAVSAYSNGSSAAVTGSSLNGPGGEFSSTSGPALITNSGNVGIGIDNPGQKLSVLGNSYFSGNMGIGTTDLSRKLSVSGNGYFSSGLEVGGTNNSHQFYVHATSFFNGNVGIGGASVGGIKLNVNGITHTNTLNTEKVNIDGKLHLTQGQAGTDYFKMTSYTGQWWTQHVSSNEDFYFGYMGDSKASIRHEDGGYITWSDRRLKKDIQPFDNVLSRLTKLQAYTYRMKTAADDSAISLGFMAQEVEEQFPQLVEERNGYKSLCYDHFAVLSVQAIKEQQAEIEDLKKRNQALESQFEELKQMVKQLSEK